MKKKSCNISFIAAALLAALGCLDAQAADYYVATNGSYANNGLTSTGAWPTVAHALERATDGDTVNVGEGLYKEWLEVTSAVTLVGSDLYNPGSPPFARHVSRTIIMPPGTNYPGSPLIQVKTNGATISCLTLNGDSDTNGVPDARCGFYCVHRPFTVTHCMIVNMGGYGIICTNVNPASLPTDGDSLRCDFTFNTISNIVHPHTNKASGIYLEHVPASCDNNEIAGISDSNTLAGIYMTKCYYASNMSSCISASSNVFIDCDQAFWGNQFGSRHEKIRVYGNTVSNCAIGIRITAAMGQARIESNDVRVSGVTWSGIPARGIWLQADHHPWDAVTDHFVACNNIRGNASAGDASAGMFLSYATTTETNINNGLRASLSNNWITGFDRGVYVESGTSGVGTWHDPLVEIRAHYNTLQQNKSYGFYSTGPMCLADASLNYWGGAGAYSWPPAAGNGYGGNALFEPPLLGTKGLDSDADTTDDWPDGDDDNDGTTDWKEVMAGTDPLNSASVFEIAAFSNAVGGGFAVRWSSVAGRKYSVWRSTNLVNGFDTLLSNNIPGTPLFNTYTDQSATVHAYYIYRVTVTN